MTIRTIYAAESWDKVYAAFDQINFAAYDYDTVKASLINYLKLYYPENFNDFIESSELIAVLEMFAYVAELLSYRVDTMSHENFISTAQRKQSILKLAKLISYRASRNIPGRGLVKLTSIKSNNAIYDSLGNNLSGMTIYWNDPNNANWKEQFMLIANSVLTTSFGNPVKSTEVNGVNMHIYTLRNTADSFLNGVKTFNVITGGSSFPFELVPCDLDDNGPLERNPDSNAQFNLVYMSDGRGDSSDYTGFMMFTKQGSLSKLDYTFSQKIANRQLELTTPGINDTDIWIYRVVDGAITENWLRVESLQDQNIHFNNLTTRKKFEVETKENDKVALIFGDESFSDAPIGDFQIWARSSANENYSIPKSAILNQNASFRYITPELKTFECSVTFSLVSAIQNNSKTESIEHIRQAAPATYYSQNRMVNGQDYNTYMYKDSSILKLKTVNRTFAGHSKYLQFNDASGSYQNVKIFGDDMVLQQENRCQLVQTKNSSRVLLDNNIEPILSSADMINALIQSNATAENAYGIISSPRKKFIEDNRLIFKDIDDNFVNCYGNELNSTTPIVPPNGSLNEKTVIQGALDTHWYGDPLEFVTINGIRHGKIKDPIINPSSTGKYYLADVPRTIDGVNTYPPGDLGPGVQPSISSQPIFGLKFNRFLKGIGTSVFQLLDAANDSLPQSYRYGHADEDEDKDGKPSPAIGASEFKHKTEVLTVEKTSSNDIFTVFSNIRGRLPDYDVSLGTRWTQQTSDLVPIDFIITVNSADVPFEQGDAFIIDVVYDNTINNWLAKVRSFGASQTKIVNLNGWWQLIPSSVLVTPAADNGAGINRNVGPNLLHQMNFDINDTSGAYSWAFLICRQDTITGSIDSWQIYYRDISIVASSPNTKFWVNNENQIIDPETKKPVRDKIRILRSNLDSDNNYLPLSHQYDIVGSVTDEFANIDYSKIKIVPSEVLDLSEEKFAHQNINQFVDFSNNAYEFALINNISTNPVLGRTLKCNEIVYTFYDTSGYDTTLYDTGVLNVPGIGTFNFDAGSSLSSVTLSDTKIVRRRRVPAVSIRNPITDAYECNLNTGLDFMWQHFSPNVNLIDPSTTNIHDAYILTSGYYTSVNQYLKDQVSTYPDAPSPLDLRISYGYLLTNKMLSDTVVFHPGKLKLLFGNKADQKLRAKFKIIKAPLASFSDERIRLETVSIIDSFFNINNWDFGRKFYATELFTLIHQKLGSQISSVVLVPTYSLNSFGSLFAIEPDLDEILQSAATVDDIEIVSELSSSVLRQS